jgi:hypothetical protein
MTTRTGSITREQLRRITVKPAKQITDAQNEARRLRPAFDLDALSGSWGLDPGKRGRHSWRCGSGAFADLVGQLQRA